MQPGGETTQINVAFASDLAEFLKAHTLEKRISIIPNPAGNALLSLYIPSGRSSKVTASELDSSPTICVRGMSI